MGLRGKWRTMTSEFSDDVQTIVGPLLQRFGFVLYGSDDTPDEGGRYQHVGYYRSDDCKIQIYHRPAKARSTA